MAELLKLPHLVDQYGMTYMQIGCRRIKTGFDNECLTLGEFRPETVLRQHLVGATFQFRNLILYFGHLHPTQRAVCWQRNCSILGGR